MIILIICLVFTRERCRGSVDPQVAGQRKSQHWGSGAKNRHEQALAPSNHIRQLSEHRASDECQQSVRVRYCTAISPRTTEGCGNEREGGKRSSMCSSSSSSSSDGHERGEKLAFMKQPWIDIGGYAGMSGKI